MNSDLLVVLGLLGATIAMFAANRPPMDAVALLIMILLPLTGIITVPEALAGLADANIVLIAALFVIGEGLVRTGVAQQLGNLLVRRAGKSETHLILLLMGIVAGVGAFMSSTGVVAIFIPVVLRVAFNLGIAPGRLMMPLSIAALVSGMMTLVATAPNLVVNAELTRHGLEGFGFFAFTPFGVPILLVAVLYMLVARRWLCAKEDPAAASASKPCFSTWIKEYQLKRRGFRLALQSGSPWIGRTIAELNLRSRHSLHIVSIERRRHFSTNILSPQADTVLEVQDVLFASTRNPQLDIGSICQENDLKELPFPDTYLSGISHSIGMAELIVPPESKLIGKTVLASGFRTEYDLEVISLKRNHKAWKRPILEAKFAMGDVVLVGGAWHAIRKIHQGDRRDLIVMNMPAELENAVPVHTRAPFALGILALVVSLMVWGAIPNVLAALTGCLLLGLCRCIDMSSAYRAIHWPSLLLIVGMLPFSLALERTGGIELAAGFLGRLGDLDPRVMLAALFSVTALLGLFISNTATAVLMTPLALAVASEMGVSPYPFCMTVALAASAAFMTPVSSPVNTLVVGPGRYTFFDFVRIGVPLTLLVMLVTVILVPLVLPFKPGIMG
ncbi:MAG: SLC13 family permease [Desulfobulbus sp.]|jgi:di/tricarboxylate transporter|uniref:SLC13 family permease n=1 Tax=Desulfobulbus sp. TaxID=895 RepID=UPI00283BE5D1|nr:SLC13 family permease [Desulfobulbus sp.]MDR2549142.1 SLC13 family permease [Desulfobulbus sp.]